MIILHTADWHLGATFHDHNRTVEHRHFLNWLLQTLREQRPDALIVAGDVFDTANPPAAAEGLFYNFMTQAAAAVPGLQIVVVAGNHDSGARLEAPAQLLRQMGVYVRGLLPRDPETDEPDLEQLLLPLAPLGQQEAACVCMAMPYLRPADCPPGQSQAEALATYFDKLHALHKRSPFKRLPVVVAAHFYAAGGEVCAGEHSERLVVGGQDCVEASVVGRNVSYTALGHLHRAQQVAGGPNVYYAGSALPMSFSEQGYKHGVWRIDLDSEGTASVSRLAYEPLRHLMSIPAGTTRAAASRDEVLDECNVLPKRKKGDDGSDWPYLEIRLEEKQPEPDLLHQVRELLADRAVHFCRMVRVRPEAEVKAEADALKPQADALHPDEPITLAQNYYRQIYKTDMPQPMADRFNQASELVARQLAEGTADETEPDTPDAAPADEA